ncbi:hypothetical protein [Mesorhizobium sp. NFR06]|uniref:hypothetical protein n=1 Tax=Mesorhizobium sp. NFR06 TaxID=1566290 RepID=UPI00165F4927|nr:hypothetical protein [Mesorhizobium sp. NFR06]
MGETNSTSAAIIVVFIAALLVVIVKRIAALAGEGANDREAHADCKARGVAFG